MRDAVTNRSQNASAQCVIAAFDDWEALQAVLDAIGRDALSPWSAVLHARTDTEGRPACSGLLGEMKQLNFARAHLSIACTAGQVAEMLAAGLAGGARAPADVLGQCLNSHQARQLQHHIECGRLVLWLELRSSEEFGAVCAHLVRASPHVVELCDVASKTRN